MEDKVPASGRQVEELLAAVPLSVAELRRAVGGFEGDAAGMVSASIRTAERAFAELDACAAAIDEAGRCGGEVAGRIRKLTGEEAVAEVEPELEALRGLAEDAWSQAMTLRLLNRVLGRDAEAGVSGGMRVSRLDEAELPVVPSVYDDGDDYDDLMAFAERRAEIAPSLELAHAERISRVAAHLVAVVERAARSGFADKGFARESLEEARRTWELWGRCVGERRRDLGR